MGVQSYYKYYIYDPIFAQKSIAYKQYMTENLTFGMMAIKDCKELTLLVTFKLDNTH